MLKDSMAATGRWLFQRRGVLPWLMLPLFAIGLWNFSYPGGSHVLDLVREVICLAVALAGLAIRVAAVAYAPRGTSGRGKSLQAETLNTSGMYSVVRHPLYLGNFLIFTGALMALGQWHLVLIGALAYWLYYERIMLAEEEFLEQKYGETFRAWAAATPAILPRFRQWRAPDLEFSVRDVLKREHTTFFTIICLFTAIEVAGDYVVEGRLEFDPLWRVIFLASLVFYIVVRSLKKYSNLLKVTKP